MSWGGKRKGSGRKPLASKELLVTALEAYITDEEVVQKLRDKIHQGDMRAIKLYFEIKYGKPSSQVEIHQPYDYEGIDFKRVLKFDD